MCAIIWIILFVVIIITDVKNGRTPGVTNQSVAQHVNPTGELVTTNVTKKLILPHQVIYFFARYRNCKRNRKGVKLMASRTSKPTGYSGPHSTLEFDGFTPLIWPVSRTGHGEPGYPNPCGLSLKLRFKSSLESRYLCTESKIELEVDLMKLTS